MTKDENQILLTNCEVLLALLDQQIAMAKSIHALVMALEPHFPNLKAEHAKMLPDAEFLTATSASIRKLRDQTEHTVELLKKALSRHP
jgi:hypothetical protein